MDSLWTTLSIEYSRVKEIQSSVGRCQRDCEGRDKEVVMPIPFKLDYVIERTPIEQDKDKPTALVSVKLPVSEARAVWPRILQHKWFLSERLGRDVGLRVAVIDYFENIHQ